MFARALDRLLDLAWDASEPIAGKCPVCALWRGVFIGVGGVFAVSWLF